MQAEETGEKGPGGGKVNLHIPLSRYRPGTVYSVPGTVAQVQCSSSQGTLVLIRNVTLDGKPGIFGALIKQVLLHLSGEIQHQQEYLDESTSCGANDLID